MGTIDLQLILKKPLKSSQIDMNLNWFFVVQIYSLGL